MRTMFSTSASSAAPMRAFPTAFVLASSLAFVPPAAAIELGSPVACALGEDCFLQQFADMDPGPQALDPFCGDATYDGHNGTDVRVMSMADLASNVPVLAMADGTVLRLRDGLADRLALGDEDRAAVADMECGNGVVLAHADGFETQYCHLRQGSISVAMGDTVRRGDPIGAVGASGMTEFPHVHVSVRKDGVEVDPMTGRALSQGCLADPSAARPLFSPEVAAALGHGESTLMAAGLAGGIVDNASLVMEGPPPAATSGSEALVAWGWIINLRAGDRIRFRITAPDGEGLVDTVSEPLDRPMATYSAYAGLRRQPEPGRYLVDVAIMRGQAVVEEKSEAVTVE